MLVFQSSNLAGPPFVPVAPFKRRFEKGEPGGIGANRHFHG